MAKHTVKAKLTCDIDGLTTSDARVNGSKYKKLAKDSYVSLGSFEEGAGVLRVRYSVSNAANVEVTIKLDGAKNLNGGTDIVFIAAGTSHDSTPIQIG